MVWQMPATTNMPILWKKKKNPTIQLLIKSILIKHPIDSYLKTMLLFFHTDQKDIFIWIFLKGKSQWIFLKGINEFPVY